MTTTDERFAQRKGTIYVSAAAVCWSLGGLFFHAIDLDPWTISFWRSTFASLFLASTRLVFPQREQRKLDCVHALIICLGTAISMGTFIPALDLTAVANVSFIYSTAPILTALLARFILNETLDAISLASATAVMVAGIILFSGSMGTSGLAGDFLALVSTLALVFVALAVRSRPGASITMQVCIANVLVATVAFHLAPSLVASAFQIVLLAAFGLVQVTLSFGFFQIGAALLPARKTALINALEGPLSPLWVWIVFGETLAAHTILSGIVIITAVMAHIVLAPANKTKRREVERH